MNVAEIPMILFTTIAQMCVGAFLVLGVIYVLASLKYPQRVIDRLTDPTLFAIGPAMIVGLMVSMLHMHDIGHTLNVLRHWNSSWLSREIIFGTTFAGFGFLFFVLQWRKWGPFWARQVVAGIAALLGVGLLYSMSMIYYSLITVPGWHSWFTPVQFCATALLLGSLLVACAFVIVGRWNPTLPGSSKQSNLEDDQKASALMRDSVRGLTLTALLAVVVILVATPMYLAGLAAQGGVAAESALAYHSGAAVVRYILLVMSAALLALFGLTLAAPKKNSMPTLVLVMVAAFCCAGIGELMGRALFYETMKRVGI